MSVKHIIPVLLLVRVGQFSSETLTKTGIKMGTLFWILTLTKYQVYRVEIMIWYHHVNILNQTSVKSSVVAPLLLITKEVLHLISAAG